MMHLIKCFQCNYEWDSAHTAICPRCGRPYNFESEKSRLKMQPRNGSATFYKLLEQAGEIHDSKSHDYASSDDPFGNYTFAGKIADMFEDHTDMGLIGRFAEKLFRLSNLETKEPKNETIEDAEIDLLIIIGLFISNRRDRRKSNLPQQPS